MGCFTSRIAGPDFTTINADMSASPIHRHKSEADTSHYETEEEHDRDLQRLSTSQRRPSRPAYVDPNDQPMPPKTTHQHYHRRASENTPQQESNTGWKEKVKNAVMTPADERGMGRNQGVSRQEAQARGYPARGPHGTMRVRTDRDWRAHSNEKAREKKAWDWGL